MSFFLLLRRPPSATRTDTLFPYTTLVRSLLIGVTLIMAGVYRGMVDDGKALLDNSGADLWVVQKDTLGPYAESSSLPDDIYRSLLAMPGDRKSTRLNSSH